MEANTTQTREDFLRKFEDAKQRKHAMVEKMKDIRIDGDGKLYAETTSGSITVPYESGAPVSCVRYDISALSRGNCYSYIVLDGCGIEGKTIIADGTNIIDIDGANTDEQVNSITFYPVPIRGVSFRISS